MANEEPKESPAEGLNQQQQEERTPVGSARKIRESLFTPRFKSVAAMAGWDEEAILVASLVVEDTPDRDVKQQGKKRHDLVFKSPASASLRRKHKTRRRSSVLIPSAVLNLDEEEIPKQEKDEEKAKKKDVEIDKKTKSGKELTEQNSGAVKEKDVMNDKKIESGKELTEQNSGDSCSKSALPCMDKLREELSCAICLDICFEPSTTSCGHSFCKQCLRSAATKCGKKCPKCRQLISSGRSCPVNTVLWNTIQLLFPEELEARKDAAKASRREEAEKNRSLEGEDSNSNPRRRSVRPSRSPISIEGNAARRNFERESSISRVLRSRNGNATTRRTGIVSQDNDSALALRLQREEFMVAFRGSGTQSFTSARENLRAMASRALSLRTRRHPV